MLSRSLRFVLAILLALSVAACSRTKEPTIDPSALPELTDEIRSQTHAAISGRWALDHETTLSRLSSAKRGIASAYLSGLTAGVVFSEDGNFVQTVARSSGLTITEGKYEIEAADEKSVLVRLIPNGQESGPRRDIFIEGPNVLRFSIDGHSANAEGDPFRRVTEEEFDAQMKAIADK